MNIQIAERERSESYSVEEIVRMAPRHIQLEERVPNVMGKALDLLSLYEAWVNLKAIAGTEAPTHLRVKAADEFEAIIPWTELTQSALLYEQENLPLEKGYPLRLYVPNGSSECLNVKSVVSLDFLHESVLGETAKYGFKNKVSTADLKKSIQV